jgi:hypothetical protein
LRTFAITDFHIRFGYYSSLPGYKAYWFPLISDATITTGISILKTIRHVTDAEYGLFSRVMEGTITDHLKAEAEKAEA